MCRLSAITSSDYISPMENIHALETMKEGHDGSGLGLMLKDMAGPFADFKQYPTLSAICSDKGLAMLEEYMKAQGFPEKFSWEPPIKNVAGVERREHYIAKVYDYPAAYKDKSKKEQEDLLMQTRLALRLMGEPDGSLFVFSFYPDVLTLKEVGDPLQLGEFFGIEKSGLKSKIVLAQGTAEHQLRHLSLCLPSLLHPGLRHHDERREHGLCADPRISHGPRQPGVHGIQFRLRGLHPHPALHEPDPRVSAPLLQGHHHADEGRGDRRAAPTRRRSGCSRSRSVRSASTARTA